MIEWIKEATYIYFRGKDQGVTIEMLKQIGALGGAEDCDKKEHYGHGFRITLSQHEKYEYWYLLYVENRQASLEEVGYLLRGIVRICKGIEIELAVEQYNLLKSLFPGIDSPA